MDLIIRKRQRKLIENLNNHVSITKMSKLIEGTYPHTSLLIKAYKKEGLLNLKKIGRKNIISITEKGKSIRNSILNLKNQLK